MTSTQELDQSETQAAVLGEAPVAPAPTTTVINNNLTVAEPAVGWVLKVIPKHNCILPEIDNRTFVGSIWKCGECEQNHLVYERRGKNAGTKAFRRIDGDTATKKIAEAKGNETDPEE